MEVGSSGGPDKNQVYGLSNTTADNLRSTRSVSTVGSSQSKELREMVMNMATQSGTCAPYPFWSYNHQPPPLGSPPPPPAPPLY